MARSRSRRHRAAKARNNPRYFDDFEINESLTSVQYVSEMAHLRSFKWLLLACLEAADAVRHDVGETEGYCKAEQREEGCVRDLTLEA